MHLRTSGTLLLSMLLCGCASTMPTTTSHSATDVQQNRRQAAPELGDTPTLDDYLAYAAKNNAGLKAAFNRWKATLERIPQVRALPDPRFNYTYFIEEVETRVGPQNQKFGLAQTFPWFGKLSLRKDAASEAAAAEHESYERIKLQLFYRVKAAYHEYWYLAQTIAVTKEHIRLVTNMEGVARTRLKAGSVPYSAVIQAQVELGKLDDRLRTMEAMRVPVVAKLNAALNRPARQPLPWPHSLPEIAGSFTDEQAMQALVVSNPDLRGLDHSSRQEDAGIKLARKNYFPDLTLGVDYVDTDDALNPGLADSGKDPVMAMVSVNVPIWYGKYRAAEREARLRKAAVDESRTDMERRLGSELQLALYHFRDAERKIDLFGDTLVPKAEQSLQVTQQGFEAGSTGFIALLDAQRVLLEFQLSHKQAQAGRATRLAEVEMLVGRAIGGQRSEDGKQKSEVGEKQ
jgi:cobalt-zinc-cadmium efflux system outer membrane protein